MKLTGSISGFLCLAALAAATNAGAQEKTPLQFVFGAPAKGNAIAIAPTNIYSDAAGYGFEPGADVAVADDCVTSTNPFYFSVKLPLAKFIVDDFKGFDPAHPDPVDRFQMPASPIRSSAKPLGN